MGTVRAWYEYSVYLLVLLFYTFTVKNLEITTMVPPPQTTVAAEPTDRWASLADRLNPNRASFDPILKATWKTMGKAERKRFLTEDRKAIHALKTRGSIPLPFETDPDDHCETSSIAYTHIKPLLKLIAKRLEKDPSELNVYDPYFCAGGTAKHLKTLGFEQVYNVAEDFYEVITDGRIPTHDVLLTNPPYSGNHFDRLLDFLRSNKKPFLLLLPDHFSRRPAYLKAQESWLCPVFLTPPERYHYWTPEGRRSEEGSKKRKHKNLHLGSRNSPFCSRWFISLAPLLSPDELLSLVNGLDLPAGCTIAKEKVEIEGAARIFRGRAVDVLEESPKEDRRENSAKELEEDDQSPFEKRKVPLHLAML